MVVLSCKEQKMPTNKEADKSEESECSKPTSLTASIISETSLLLRWFNNCENATGFVIESKSDKDWVVIARQPQDASFYFDENIDLINSKYQYRIKPLFQSKDGPYSDVLVAPDVPSDMNDIYKYSIQYPEGYKEKGDKDYPLMIFLHGAGERGTDLSLVDIHGPVKELNTGRSMPCIIVSPQCPENVYWQVNRLEKTLAEVLEENRIDRSRMYLTGLSMGGYGTWNWAAAHPETFAAIAPVCGGGNPDLAEALVNMPIWVFHGAKDEVVPLSESENMVNAIKKVGGNVKLTTFPEAGHDSWTETYNNDAFYKWLFSQKK